MTLSNWGDPNWKGEPQASYLLKVNALMYGETDKFLFFDFLCTYLWTENAVLKIFLVESKIEWNIAQGGDKS